MFIRFLNKIVVSIRCEGNYQVLLIKRDSLFSTKRTKEESYIFSSSKLQIRMLLLIFLISGIFNGKFEFLQVVRIIITLL